MPEPIVSVVVPVYNGERFIAQAIDSILGQTRPVRELIVVDDGSTDRTAAVAQVFVKPGSPVRYVHQANAGQAAVRNRGVELAQSEFLAFLDADDVWMPDKIAAQLAAFEADTRLDMVFGHTEQFLDEGAPPSAAAALAAGKRIMAARLPSAMLIRRAAFVRVGPFTSRWKVSEVVDWLARAEEVGLKSRVLDQIVYRRRIHGGNITHRQPQAQQDYLAMVKAALDRRRARQTGDPRIPPVPPDSLGPSASPDADAKVN